MRENKVCSVVGCEVKSHARGMCNPHYLKVRRHGDPHYKHEMKNKGKACSVEGCDKQPVAHKLCAAHYARLRRNGDPNISQRDVKIGSVEERFWYRVVKDPDHPKGCWEWSGSLSSKGYGQMSVDNKPKRCYKVSYEIHFGEVPQGLHIDHSCLNKQCVHPDHLRLATNKENSENIGLSKSNTSGYRGVCWDKERSKWIVQVGHHGKTFRGGAFDDIEEANRVAIALRNNLYTHNTLDRQ